MARKPLAEQPIPPTPDYWSAWKRGLPTDPGFFPISVWLQAPEDAKAYRDAGINLFVGLFKGPTEEHLAFLREADMKVICHQNEVGLKNADDPVIAGWMHGDEPDNAQAKKDGGEGYDPCIDPKTVIERYNNWKTQDPTRPIYLNLGQGVSLTDWVGRGVCRGRTDMYPEYSKGADILSYDIYPVNSGYPEVQGNLYYVADGVDNLREWSNYKKPVWCWIECTKIGDRAHGSRKPTVAEVKSEVWMALVRGATGFGYFCHEFGKNPKSNAPLSDPEMLAGINAINMEVHNLAAVLNSPSVPSAAGVSSSSTEVPVDIMVKQHEDATYVFAVAMRKGKTTAAITVSGGSNAEALGEGRDLELKDGVFEDSFEDYAVHLYKIS